MSKKEKKRFEFTLKEDSTFGAGFRIIKDTQTGVQYLLHYDGYVGGLTPLLDKDGKPSIDVTDNSV